MTEAITESFCERCGTRYEFKAPTRLNSLRKTRGFLGGLKNYVMSQDALGDAMGDAMRSEEDALASAQLEAFHESFNFCIDCRQYTCVACWNDDAGRCRSCVPVVGTDDLIERMRVGLAEPLEAPIPSVPLPEFDVWPSADLPIETNGDVPSEWPAEEALPVAEEPEPVVVAEEPEPVVVAEEPEPVVVAEEPEPVVVAEEPEPVVVAEEPEPVVVAEEPEPVVVAEEPEPEPAIPFLRVLSWDEDAPLILEQPVVAEEPEPVVVAEEPEPVVVAEEPEPVVVAEEPEPVVAEEPEPVVAEEPEPTPPKRITPISETILHFPGEAPPAPEPAPQAEPTQVAAEDLTPEVAARRAQLDSLGIGDPGRGVVGTGGGTVLPYRSRGASPHASDAARLASATQHASFWAASAREVAGAASQVGVQNCGECGLSLSATARFCRRCGTQQAQSA